MKNYLITFVVSSILAFAIGFLPPEDFRIMAYQNLSWYFMLAALLMLVYAIYCADASLRFIESLKENRKAAILAAAIVVLGFFVSPPDFRILADETNLLGVSMEMHETRRCMLPMEAMYYYQGVRRNLSEKLEMRPPAFPFALSLLHNLTGYRVENAFLLNGFCAWLSLFLLFLFIDRRERGLWGYVAMLAMAAYPVFVQYFTSAGFETFNLAMVMLTFYLLDQFLETRNLWISVAVVSSLILLSHSRYESIVTVICVAPVLLYFLPKDATDDWREKFVFAFPMFLLPALWLRSTTWDATRFQVDQLDQAFSFSNFLPNLKNFVVFFLSGKSQDFAGPVLSLLAFVGLVLLMEKFWNMKLGKEQRYITISMAACAIMHLLARLFYSYGDLMNPITMRLSLVFLPVFAGLAITGMRRIERFKSPVNIAPAIVILMLTLIASSWPVASSGAGFRGLTVQRVYRWVRNVMLEKNVGEETVIISNRPNMFVPLKVSAITFETASLMAENLEKLLKIKSYSRFLVIQHINYRKDEPEESLPANLVAMKNTVWFESQLSTTHYIRVTEIKLN